jgi:hypothetical protein
MNNKLDRKSTNDICGMCVDEYLEEGSASGYCVIQTRINDDIPLLDCEGMLAELKEKGVINNDAFKDNVWSCFYDLYEINIKFDFNIYVPQEVILSLKKYMLVKLYLKKNEVKTVQIAFHHIKDMLEKTSVFDIDTVPDFRKYVSNNQTVLYLSNCKEFLQFCTFKEACEFYSKIKNFTIRNNPKSREIPSYDSILKYDCLIRNFIDTGNIDLRMKYCSILIWWMISTIIPLRPSEFLLLRRNCIYKKKEKFYIHIERIKSKSDRKNYNVPIMTEFQIPEALFEFISDYIDYANEIDRSDYLVSDNFYIKQLTRNFFLLDAQTMGVPQRRKRVFFIARRNDLNLPKLVLDFREKPIYFGEVRSAHGIPLKECMMASLIKKRKPGDKCFSDISERVRGKRSMFNDRIVEDHVIAPTNTSGGMNVRYADGEKYSDADYISTQTFPQDYDFGKESVQYVCGMSVPPVMMAQIASAVYEQWLKGGARDEETEKV